MCVDYKIVNTATADDNSTGPDSIAASATGYHGQ